jgi:uncharacterized protein (DUF1330 family)
MEHLYKGRKLQCNIDSTALAQAAHWSVTPKYPTYRSAVQDIVRKEGFGALYMVRGGFCHSAPSIHILVYTESPYSDNARQFAE